ncbi:NusG domain II-containing protein [Clostridium sp. KNHs214]|uniref:NusG domain II-containing protein n=1 Tax=Clostridium sp. KNHs214 TaxID=1540257 RepID=UPI000556E0BE|nr:NusG domain II-containing protein [Clostridium sp. KNHs214]
MKKGDRIVLVTIMVLIICSIVGILGYRYFYKNGKAVAIIKQNGKIIRTIDLSKVTKKEEIKIPSADGHYNIIKVEKGKIRFMDADCPDKICIKSGWIKKPGDSAACLPHKIIITIQGQNSEVDDVVY